MEPTISIIIPTLNRPHDLKNALDSILLQTLRPKEVIIVDQSENSLTKELVESFNINPKSAGISFIWHTLKEKGSARARNQGFRSSVGDVICFTDDDVVLGKDYLKSIVMTFETYPQVGGVSGNVDGPVSPSGFKWFLRKLLLRLFLLDFQNGRMTVSGFGYPIFLHEIKVLTYVELFAGYSMNFRRQYLEYDLFDEFFTGYSFREDVELSYRISRKTKLVMIPEARFQHNASTSNRTDWKTLKRMQFRNYSYIFNKHKRRSFVNFFLFAYSIGGILIMDLFEWLCGFKPSKWQAFLMDISAISELMSGQL